MIKNYFSLVTSELLSRVVSFFWIVYMARYLGVADYGRYSTVLAFISIATSFIDFGVHFILVREIIKKPEWTSKFLGAQIYLRSFISVTALVILALNVHGAGFPREMKALIILAGLHMVFHNVGMIGDTIFSAYNKQYLTAIMHIAHNLGWALLGFLSLKFNGGLKLLLCAMAINSAVICVVYLWIVFTKFAKPDFRLPFSFIFPLVKAAVPIGLTGIFAMGFQRIDRILLSASAGAYEVGLYSAAMTLIGPVQDLVWSSAIIVLYPYMASLYEDQERFKTVFKNVTTWIFAGLLGCTIVFVAFPDQIISFAFGKKFERSTYLLALLSLQMIPLTFHGFLSRLLLVQHKQKAYGLANFAAFVTNLALNLILIRKYGILGATISCLATNVLLVGYYMLFGRVSLLGYIDLVKLSKVVLVGFASVVIVRLAGQPNLFVSLGIYSVAYLVLATFLLSLPKEWKKTTALLPRN